MPLPYTLPFTLGITAGGWKPAGPATVLLLNPTGVDVSVLMPELLRGTVTDGNSLIDVIYPNLLLPGNIEIGAAALDAVINTISGPKIVFGYSLGCCVAYQWLREYGPTSSVSPGNTTFVMAANPENKYGGMLALAPGLVPSLAPVLDFVIEFLADGAGIPDSTPYTVTNLIRQYDGYADFPQHFDWLAITNAIVVGIPLVHNFYFDVAIDDPQNAWYTEGNVSYVWSPTRLMFPDYYIAELEKAYDRPVTLPGHGPIVGESPPPPPTEDAPLEQEPWRVAETVDKLAAQREPLLREWIVEVADKLWVPVGSIGDDLMELNGTDPRNAMPSAQLTLKGNSVHTDLMMSCQNTMVGVKVETGGLRFPFYVDTFDYEFKDDAWTGTAQLNGIWDILNYYQIWPDWLSPIQAQIISHAVFVGPLCTVIETMIAECALRIQSGLNEFINNALSLNPDIRAWFGTLLQSNGNILQLLKTPLYVVRTNPFLDTSPLVVKTVRMESCGTVIQELTKAYGVIVTVDLWLPGDEQPDYYTENFSFLSLDQPTYVVRVLDRSQIEGPTKTVLDSVIRTVVDVGGSFFGEVPGAIDQVEGMQGVFTSPLLGVDFVPPWAVLVAPEPGEKGSVVSCKLSFHTPKGWQHIIGGRSPKWLNDLMNATFAWLIDSISILIGISGIPSNLLDGFLNNAFLAFQLIELYQRRNDVGPYHPAIERFYPTASAPYNIETVFAFVNAIWDSRGYMSAQATFRDGEVYKLGRDVFKGGLMSVLYMGRRRLFTDYVENILFRLTTQERDVFVQIGDGKAEESPLAKHQRFITGTLEAINVLTLSPQS